MDPVTHFEIPIENPDRASHFYEHIFGWEVNEVEGMLYWMIHTTETDEQMPKKPGAINGGFTLKEDTDRIVIVITVEDIDEKIKKIISHRGEIVMEKRKVGDMGWYARFKDPEGNIIGIWQDIKK